MCLFLLYLGFGLVWFLPLFCFTDFLSFCLFVFSVFLSNFDHLTHTYTHTHTHTQDFPVACNKAISTLVGLESRAEAEATLIAAAAPIIPIQDPNERAENIIEEEEEEEDEEDEDEDGEVLGDDGEDAMLAAAMYEGECFGRKTEFCSFK